MAHKSTTEKLRILADAAKYDASCASSAAPKRNALSRGGIGSTEGMGICHAYAPDGRCISLLKVLLTNFCLFDCRYCVNRVSSNVERARFSPRELADLTINFYKRNYIEGLFLSSGIIQSPDYTMEQIIEVARILREEHLFQGYIHLKTIPEADQLLIDKAARLADRLSINVELPTPAGLQAYAPEKQATTIRKAMAGVKLGIDEARSEGPARRKPALKPPKYSPAGQSTQMIVGADQSTDKDIILSASNLYSSYRLSRVYYSAFSPIPDASTSLPPTPPPLMREHRLYQADWMVRFYEFEPEEIISTSQGGMLDLHIDPKLAWALANRHAFPVNLNTASREQILRVPGLGPKSVDRLIKARRFGRLRHADVNRIVHSMRRVEPFIELVDWTPGGLLDSASLRGSLSPASAQLSLF